MIIIPTKKMSWLTTNLPYPDPIDPLFYSGSTTYNTGHLVQIAGYGIYKCLRNFTIGLYPPDNRLEWQYVSKINVDKCFDSTQSSQTINSVLDGVTNTFKINYTFDIDVITDISLFNLDASTITARIVRLSSSTVVPNQPIDITKTITDTVNIPLAFFSFGFYLDVTLEITIEQTPTLSDKVGVGHLTYGVRRDVGVTLSNPAPTVSIRNLNKRVRDEDGIFSIINKVTYKVTNVTMLITEDKINYVQRILTRYSNVACVFMSDDTPEICGSNPPVNKVLSFLTYGMFKDLSVGIAFKDSIYKLEINGTV